MLFAEHQVIFLKILLYAFNFAESKQFRALEPRYLPAVWKEKLSSLIRDTF